MGSQLRNEARQQPHDRHDSNVMGASLEYSRGPKMTAFQIMMLS